MLLTNLRVLGYVFNPVSFYYCYRGDGSLGCIVAEVNNTFGERLPSVLHRARRAARTSTRKRLHVSPFFGLDQSYSGRSPSRGTRSCARIDLREDGGRPF